MKLRILNNSLRLRLSQTEVGILAEQKRVSATVHFSGAAVLHYCIELHDEVQTPVAVFEDHRITISLPPAQGLEWANSNTVSLRANNVLDSGDNLTILIEKDFKCLTDRPSEDESDLFPHPKEGEVAC